MPILDNELNGNISNRDYTQERVDLSSINGPMPGRLPNLIASYSPGYSGDPSQFQGIRLKDVNSFTVGNVPKGPNSTFGMVTRKELLDNSRYPLYERGVNLENVYGNAQSGWAQLGNGLVKMGLTAVGTFAQSFATLPDTISAIKNRKFSELSNPNGYESDIDNWLKNMEDRFPNYVTDYEKSRGLATMIPFTAGSANFWGDKVIKNLGFTVGAIGGALAQDAIVGLATEGIGEIPLIGAQIGKASLWLNKLFTGTNRLEEALSLATKVGASERRIMTLTSLARAAEAEKITTGLRYGLNLYGSSRTEAATEARDGYRQIKEELIKEYKLNNGGAEPTSNDLYKIEKLAESGMNARFGINMALLTVSNAIQFDNLLKSFNSAKKGIESITSAEVKGLGNIKLKEGSLDVFEKVVPNSTSGKVWEYIKPTVKNIFTEGIYEEGGQYAAEKGTFDYYTRKYKNSKDWNWTKEVLNSTVTGLQEQFGSKEGIENMVIGALTASITSPISSRIEDITKGKSKDQMLQSVISTVNQYGLTGILSNKFEDTANSVAIAKQMNDAVKSNNIFKYKNLKADLFFNFVNSRLSVGMHDVTIEQLKLLKDLPKEEFEKTFGMNFDESNKSTVAEYVDSLIIKADNIKAINDSIQFSFKNPFQRIINPTNEEEKNELINYSKFENWKTNLVNLSYLEEDTTSRTNSIEKQIQSIHSGLNNSLLSSTFNIKGLSEFSSIYEEKANQLEQSINSLPLKDRAAVRSEVKKLRTLVEKIGIIKSNKSIDAKTLKELLEFELSGQNFENDINLRFDQIEKLMDFAGDLNLLNSRNEAIKEGIEFLTSEKGVDKFINEDEENFNEDEEKTNDEVLTYVDNKGNNKTIDVGREYQLPNIKLAKVRKSGEKYKVTSPDGKVTFYDTKEEANLAKDELNIDFSELSKVKILAINKDGSLKVEDLAGNIQNISKQSLNGYEFLLSKQEELLKTKDVVSKDQEELETVSGTTETINENQVDHTEGKLKEASILFKSSITESEDWDNPEQSAPHIKRARIFLNNVARFKNRKNYKVILITPNNAKTAGLEGIVQLSYKRSIDTPLSEIEDVTNPENGFMAQVFVYTDKSGSYFVNEKGEKIGKVGKQLENIESSGIVFQTMPAATLYNSKGTPRFRKNEEEKANRELAAYKIFREKKFANDAIGQAYPFKVSRGVRRKTEIKEDNHISSILGKDGDKIISSISSLLEVVTTGKISFNGELISFPKGTVVFKYGDTLDFANNKPLTEKQASSVYAVIEKLADDVLNGKSIQGAYSNFLQNILYWKSKAETTSPSQIKIDVNTMSLHLGKESFPISEISQRKDEIINALKQAFITVNDKTLKEGVNKTFIEYALNTQGELKPIVWKNYQEYLLSDKYPNGDKRDVSETPLITHAPKPTELFPSSYVQRYSTIEEGKLEFPYELIKEEPVPIKQESSTETKKEQPKQQNKYNLTPGIVNGYKLNDGRDILFTGEMTHEGPSISIQQTSVFNDIVANKVTINGIRLNIEKIGTDTSKMSDAQVLDFYLKLLIVKDIENQNEQQQTTQSEQTQETAQGQTTETNIQSQQGTVATRQGVSADIGLKKTREQAIKEAEEKWAENVDDRGFPIESLQPILAKINKEYDELEANNVSKETSSSENPPVNFSKLKTKGKGKGLQFRKLGISDSERMTEEDIKEFKKWHAENVPNIPFEILEQMIVINSTESAWGVFEDGVAKFVRGGLKGTEYHEVFEAIWANLLTETEKKNLLEEFRNKKGTFIDRQSGEEYNYNSPSVDDNTIKERIADDFADYRLGKIKNSSIKGMIKEFFNRIMNFFKSFVTKKSLKEKLFDEIDKGRFKNKKIVSEDKFKNVPVKSGVKELFNENSELASVGTQQQYSAYLDTVFPDSKVTEIDNSLYISVLEDLKSNKIIEKQCS
jgi:hypothetical protein